MLKKGNGLKGQICASWIQTSGILRRFCVFVFVFRMKRCFFFFLPNQFLGSILRQLTPSFTSQKPSTYLLVFSISCSWKSSYLVAYHLKHLYIVAHTVWPMISIKSPFIWAFAFSLWYAINVFILVISASLVPVTLK